MTREMASRMVRDGAVAETPEQLDAWIARTPDAREVLERDGYTRDFTAHDVFPLLQVFVAQAGGRINPVAETRPRSYATWWLAGFLVLLFVLLVFALVSNASRQAG